MAAVPKQTPPPVVTPAPSPGAPDPEIQQASADARRQRSGKKGYGSTVLTSPQGASGSAPVFKPTLGG
jgi:hypothetical protein